MNHGNKYTMKKTQYKVAVALMGLLLGTKPLDAASLDEVFRSFHTADLPARNSGIRGQGSVVKFQ